MTAYIGYDNVLDLSYATITPSSEATASGAETYVVENCYDWNEWDYWKPSASGNASIALSFVAPVMVDYIAARGSQADTRYQLEYSEDGVTWTALSGVMTLDGTSFDKFTATEIFGGLVSNMLTNSEAFDSWIKTAVTVTSDATAAPDGTDTADKMVETADLATQHRVASAFDCVTGQWYVFSVYAKAGERSVVCFNLGNTYFGSSSEAFFDLTNELSSCGVGTCGMESKGNGWYRLWWAAQCIASGSSIQLMIIAGTTYSTTYADYTYNGTLGYGLYLWGGQCVPASALTPYIKTEAAAVYNGASPAMLRVMFYPKQNRFLYASQFGNAAWTKTGGSITANDAVDPSGSVNADRFVEDTGLSNHGVTQTRTVVAGSVYSYSVHFKPNGRTVVAFNEQASYFGSGANASMDVTTGTSRVGAAGGTVEVEALDDGWYRVTRTTPPAIANGSNIFFVLVASDTTFAGMTYTGDGLSGGWFWRATLERAPEVGASVTTTIIASYDTVQLPMLALGEAMELGDIRPGFAPPGLIEAGEGTTSVSETGTFLGRSIRTRGHDFDLSQTLVAPAWVRSQLRALSEHALRKPFFFSWSYETHPDEAVLVVPDEKGAITAPSYEHPTLMRFSVKGTAWE